jgi:cell division protein FtsZ
MLTDLAGRLSNDRRRTADRIERAAPPPQFESAPLRPAARVPAPQRLDPYGRAAPARNPVEEKVIDIPSFLGRKAN